MDSIHNSRYVQYKERLNRMTGTSEASATRNDIYRNQKKAAPVKSSAAADADSASYTSSGQNAYKSLAPSAPQTVKDAWRAAAAKTGVNSLEDNSDTYLSCLYAIQAEQKSTTGSGDVLGSTAESARKAVQRALTRLEGLGGEITNTKVKEYRRKEKDFYEALLAELDQNR